MPRFKVTLAYVGTDFVGWQRQAAGVSVQGLVEDALRELEGDAVTVIGAGRTDAGVHAYGQVAAFTLTRDASAAVVVRALNARLPASVRVLAAEETAPDFHPQFSAKAKTYRYRIWNGEVVSPFERSYVWQITAPLDVAVMNTAAEALVGEHDFAAFQATGSDAATTVRTIFSSLVLRQVHPERAPLSVDRLRMSGASRRAQDERDKKPLVVSVSNHEPLVTYEITGNGFLRHMVRAIVGTLVDIGRGRQASGWMREVLDSRSRAAAGRTAPPQGLFLVRVDY